MEHINDIRITSEGKYIVVGSTSSTSIKLDDQHTITTGKETIDTGKDNYFLIQYDNTGNIEWVKNYKVSEGISMIQDIKITDDQGSMLVNAIYWHEVQLDNGQTFKKPTGYNDGIIVKYNNQGKTEWAKNVQAETLASFEGMEITTQEEILACINTTQEKIIYEGDKEFGENGKSQGLLLKYTKEGQLKKAITLKEADNAIFDQVIATQDGGYIISVEFQGKTIQVDEGIIINNEKNTGTSTVLVKFDKNDKVEWTKMLAGDELDNQEDIQLLMGFNTKILQTEDNGYMTAFYTTGKKLITDDSEYTFKKSGSIKYALIKIDSTGEIEWVKEIGDGTIQIYEITQLGTDDYLVEALMNDDKITTETGKTFDKKEGTLQIRLSKQPITPPTTKPGSDGNKETPTPKPGQESENKKPTSEQVKDNEIGIDDWGFTTKEPGDSNDEEESKTYTLDDYNKKAAADKLSNDNDEYQTITVENSPKTGDKIFIYVAIIVISAISITILAIIKIRQKRKKA